MKDNRIEPCDKVNVIFGENAQGKTNLLEALWLFCGGHSFRGAKEHEMVGFEKEFFRLDMDFFSAERDQQAQILFSNQKKKKEIRLNKVEKDSSSYLTEVFSAVVFSPEHLTLIKQGPQVRRKFVDAAICQQKVRFASILAKYQQIIFQRNALLKDIFRHPELKETLFIWDDSLAQFGAVVIKERFDYLRQFREVCRQYHSGISCEKETLSIDYLCNAGITEEDSIEEMEEKLRQQFLASREIDFRSGFTNIGPHRDDIDLLINGISARKFASQGQQRSAVLSLKLAEAQMLSQKHGEKPVILLDDVLSELDEKRQDFLLNQVDGYQVFVTCCEKESKQQLQNGKVFFVEDGVVT